MNNTGVTGLTAQNLTLSMRVFGPRISAYAYWHTTDTCTYIYHAKSRLNIPDQAISHVIQFLTGYLTQKIFLLHLSDHYRDNTIFGGSESRYRPRRDWKLRLKRVESNTSLYTNLMICVKCDSFHVRQIMLSKCILKLFHIRRKCWDDLSAGLSPLKGAWGYTY